jgi:3-methyladenine DNA glycosylase AlkD
MARSRRKPAARLTVSAVRQATRASADPDRAANLQRFFKTGPGEYGEGDCFLGLNVPAVRGLVRRFESLSLAGIRSLLRSRYHEERLLALLLLVRRYRRGDAAARDAVFDLYLRETRYINNWDLVDLSAGDIVGRHLREGDRSRVYRLAKSRSLWERRIAMIATFDWIRCDDFADTLAVAEVLLGDREDLIHKASGWMLREVGKRDADALRAFLRRHAHVMPRTMLRYAIERFPEAERQRWLRSVAPRKSR